MIARRYGAVLLGLMVTCELAQAGLSFSMNSQPAINARLLARYSFDDPNDLGRDDSGNGHDLVAFAVAPDHSAIGKIGGAAVFDGITQGYQAKGPVFPAGSFSFSLWVNPGSITQMVVSANNLSSGFNVTVGPSEFRFFTYRAGGYSWVSGYIIPDLGRWQHLTMTYEAQTGPDETGRYTGILKAYHNGILTSFMTNAEYVADSGNSLDIGHRSVSFFGGSIDEVRIYDEALTAEEVKLLITDPADVQLGSHAEIIPTSQPEATVPWWIPRHQAVRERNQQGNVDLIMIGDSITHRWEYFSDYPSGKEIWKQYYANRNAVNLGFGGDRTQHVLWRLQNGELDGINPKLAVLLIGTNNSGSPNQSPELIADGIAAILREIRTRLPNTKVLLLGIFPRGSTEQIAAGATEAVYNWQWEKIDQINELIRGMADNEMIFYLNINNQLVNARGAVSRGIMPDLLHPNEAGYAIWAAAMEPTIRSLMGEEAENEAINRLKNPGFEYKSIADGTYGRLPLYWTKLHAGTNSTFYLTSVYRKHGELSLQINDSSSLLSSGILSDPVPVKPGYVYAARAWALQSADTVSSSMYIRFYDSADQQIDQASTLVGSTGVWSSAELVRQAPANAVSARLLLYSGAKSTGSVYFDSVSFVLADEEIWDGGFSLAATNTLPANWFVYSTNAGASQAVYSDSGNNVIRLVDTSSTLPSGAYCKVPVTPGTPYRFSADVSAASCAASIYLKFYTADGTLLETCSASTTSSVYTPLKIERTAPAESSYATALLYIPIEGIGQAFFDNVSFKENYVVRYVAPVAQGNGSGTNSANAALYNSTTGSTSFWYGVNTLLASNPVKVIMLDGDYRSYWSLGSVGNSTNRLLITGETPYAVNYCGGDSSVTSNYFLYLTRTGNITLRHLHFTAEENPDRLALNNNEVYDYKGVFCMNASSNISIEGVTFTDMLMMSASACSVWANSHDITWNYCNFVKIGWDLYDHCIYNTSLAYNLNVEKCYFQDCNGVYVRYRSGSQGDVKNNTFISTGTQPTGDADGRVHWPFVQMCAFNSASTNYDEILGDRFVVSGNSFTFETNSSTSGFLAPFWIYVQGPAPANHPDYHLVPPTIGAYIENITNSISARNAYIEDYFGINLMNHYEIMNNTYLGCWPVLFMMTSEPDPRNIYWTNLPSPIPTANCDLDKLLGLD